MVVDFHCLYLVLAGADSVGRLQPGALRDIVVDTDHKPPAERTEKASVIRMMWMSHAATAGVKLKDIHACFSSRPLLLRVSTPT